MRPSHLEIPQKINLDSLASDYLTDEEHAVCPTLGIYEYSIGVDYYYQYREYEVVDYPSRKEIVTELRDRIKDAPLPRIAITELISAIECCINNDIAGDLDLWEAIDAQEASAADARRED